MRRLQLLAGVAAAMVATSTANAQQPVEFRHVYAFDSANIRFAQTSPDGIWIVMARAEGALAGNLWIARASGGAPTPLTSDGYHDAVPMWFWSGDRIAFLSTRPNRNGGRQQYLMSLAIDPATGRASTAPRQVTSETVARAFRPSPDGRWIPYIATASSTELKIVPSNGGMARSLAQVNMITAVAFSRDSRHVYYTEQAGPNGGRCANAICTWTIRRVAIEGGQAETIASAPHAIQVLPADPRYVMHRIPGAGRNEFAWELRDGNDAVLGRLQEQPNIRTAGMTGDGYGTMGLTWDWQRSIKLATVAGGPVQTVTAGDGRYAEAWMADGSALVTDRYENGSLILEVTSFSGRPLRTFPLGSGWHSSGWQTSVGPWYSYQSINPPGLHAINLETGEKKRITSTAVESHLARGGTSQDGDRWIYSERAGNRIEFRSTNPVTGETMLLRSFSDGMGNRRHFRAHGTRLTWYETRGDSVDFLVTFGPTGTPRRVFSRKGSLESVEETAAWSYRGDRMAICCERTTVGQSLTLYSIPVTADGAITNAQVDLGAAYALWAPQWLPDDSGLLMLAIMDRREDVPDLVHFPLRQGGQLSVLTRDVPQEIWSFSVSPDGRHAVFHVDMPVHRTTVHAASFKALLDGRR